MNLPCQDPTRWQKRTDMGARNSNTKHITKRAKHVTSKVEILFLHYCHALIDHQTPRRRFTSSSAPTYRHTRRQLPLMPSFFPTSTVSFPPPMVRQEEALHGHYQEAQSSRHRPAHLPIRAVFSKHRQTARSEDRS